MKLLASDLDGTLYFGHSDTKIKPQDAQAIKDFQAAGHLFGICSGRTLAGIKHALDGTDIHLDFYILTSGASLANANGHYLYQHLLTKQTICEIIYQTRSIPMSILFCHDEDYYRISPAGRMENRGLEIHDPAEAPYDTYDSLHLGFEDLATLEVAQAYLLAHFQNDIEVHHNVLNLDIAPKGCSKGAAIRTLDQYFPIDYQDIAVIGDSFNDISMLQAAPTSFTFHNSDTRVKQAARYLVNDIAEAIKLIQGDTTC